jgi:hypothetical protein
VGISAAGQTNFKLSRAKHSQSPDYPSKIHFESLTVKIQIFLQNGMMLSCMARKKNAGPVNFTVLI